MSGDVLPSRLGRYQIQSLLGQGGMGSVLRALDPVLDRDVAIKVLHANLTRSKAAREQFLREARLAASVQHDNIVPVYTVEEQAGTVYLVMEYVTGGTLAERLRAPRSLRGAEIMSIARQVTRGLEAVHARGLVHGDIKPSNLLLEPERPPDAAPDRLDWYRVKLADFGLVQVASELLPARGGTPGSMAPEQIEGQSLDARSDLYSLGAVLYHMATGRPPFVGRNTVEVVHQQQTERPARPSEIAPGMIPTELDDLIMQLLEADRAARPSTAAEVLARLDRVSAGAFLSREERARLEALRRYQVLDSDPDQALNDLTALASHICRTPIALISLVDEDRQWIKANVGLPVQQTARNVSFCSHTIRQNEALVVPDATIDRRFADNPLVRSDPNIRFYAGMPLVTGEGHALGSLCVIDRVARKLDTDQHAALAIIRRLVLNHLEMRRSLLEATSRSQPRPSDIEEAPTLLPDATPAPKPSQ